MADWETVGSADDSSGDWETVGKSSTGDGWEDAKPKTNLLSSQGAASLGRLLGPSLARSILGEQLMNVEKEYTGSLDDPMGRRPPALEERKAKAETLKKAIAYADKDIEQISGNPSLPLEAAQNITESVAQNLPGAMIAAFTKTPLGMVPGLGSAATIQRGGAYADSSDKNVPTKDKQLDANIQGTVEAALEVTPLGYIAKHIGHEGLGKFVWHLMGKELATELPTTLLQDISQKVLTEPEKPFGEFLNDLGHDLGMTALTTPFAAGVTGLAVKGASRVGGSRADQIDAEALGEDNKPLPAPLKPAWEWPTSPIPPQQGAEIDQLLKSINEELLTPKDVTEAKDTIAKFDEQRRSPQLPEAKAAWASIDAAPPATLDSSELGASDKQAANAANYINPNVGERIDRPFLYGPPGVEGLTPAQVMPQPATYTLGVASEDRPADYLKALHDTVEMWRQKWMPNATIMLSNEGLWTDSAVGWHYQTAPRMHLIVPAVLRSPKKGMAAFNPNTQASAFYNASHEFGHALVEERFFEGVDPTVAELSQKQSESGTVSEDVIQDLPAEQQGVVREFNAIKERIASGEMTAGQLLTEWMSPGKLGRKTFLSKLGVAPQAPAMDLMKAIATRAASHSGQRGNQQLIQQVVGDLLSLKEYLAEQTARHAYKTKMDQNTPLGAFFSRALKSLREFFIEQKRDQFIAPGTAFTEWIEGLGKVEKITNAAEHVAKGKKSKKVVAVAEPKPKKTRVKRVQHNVETDTAGQKELKGQLLIDTLVADVGISEAMQKKLTKLLKSGATDEFMDLYKRLEKKKADFELGDTNEEIGMKTDLKALIKVFGLSMYKGNVADVITKELVQNAFDATKAVLLNKTAKDIDKEQEGLITINVTEANNTIEVIDRGIGMDRDTLVKALLTYPGTSKPGLPPEHSSGGLGQAKQLLLFTPEKIEVMTVKDGVLTTLIASPQELLDNKAKLTTEKTTAPNGTSVRVTLPKQVERDGEMTKVEFPSNYYDYSVMATPPLFPGVKLEFNNGTDWGKAAAKSLLETHTLFATQKHEWGYVDVYVGETYEEEQSWKAKHRVMSAGLWQFDTQIPSPFDKYESLPMDVIFDLHPSVPGQHGAYPFTPNRQGFKDVAKKQVMAAVEKLQKEYVIAELKKHVEAYTNVLEMTPEGFTKPEFTVSQDTSQRPVITFTRGVNAPPALYYNPTNKDYLSVPGAKEYFLELVKIHQDFIKFYAKVFNPTGQLYSSGIGLDRGKGVDDENNNGWGGLHFQVPYRAMWLNPVYDRENIDPASVASGLKEAMMHEAMHINARSHDAPAFWELHRMYSVMDKGDDLQQIKDRLQETVAKFWATHSQLSEMYNDKSTTNTGVSVKGEASERVGGEASIDDTLEALRSKQGSGVRGPGSSGTLRNVSFELDISDDPEGEHFVNKLRNFLPDMGTLRRALRRAQGMAYAALQMQQLAHLNPDLADLTSFLVFNTRYNTRKALLQAAPDRISDQWSRLSRENFDKLGKMFLEESEGTEHWTELTKENGVWVHKMSARTMQELEKRGIDINTELGAEVAKIYLDVKNDLLSKLNEKEKVMQVLLAHRYANATPEVLRAAIIPLKHEIHEMRKVPFFPRGRFGNLMITVEKHKLGGGWEVVHSEAFETRKEWQEAHKKMDAAKKADERIRAHELTDQEYVLMALPSEFIELAASELDLAPEQVETLLELLQPVKKEKALRGYDLSRLGIKGYSDDALRSYSNFSWHDANLIAKIEYRKNFNLTIRNIGVLLRRAQYSGPGAEKEVFRLTRVEKAMKNARDYIMSPPNEAQQLRGVISVAYLGLNVKTALINFYGLVTTWSDMGTRLGAGAGSLAMAKATYKMFKTVKLTNLNERREGNYLSPELQKALDRALEEGVLSQSYAYHLAAKANESQLFRGKTGPGSGLVQQGVNLTKRGLKHAVDASMWPFRLTELGTRRVSFIAEFEQAMKEGVEDPYETTVLRVNKLQNDYSLGNRVPFMRGFAIGKSHPAGKYFEPVIPLATVFWSFAQHMAFHSYGGYELGERRAAKIEGKASGNVLLGYTAKIWLVTLLLAGYEGLPGAENILDLIEAAWRKFGGQKPIRQMLREVVQAIHPDLDPQWAAHGFGHNILGFDISRSLGLGKMVPGTDTLSNAKGNLDENVGSLVLDMFGATGSFVKFGLEATFSDKSPADTFQHLPGGLGNIYSAYYWSKHGVVTPKGALITHDLETGKLRDLTSLEIFGKALGFNPTIVSQNREMRAEEYERKVFWQTRRSGLLDNVWEARWQKDREAEGKARKAIEDYNRAIPTDFKSLRVTGADIAKHIQAGIRAKQADEQNTTPQKRFRPLYRDVQGSFGPKKSSP